MSEYPKNRRINEHKYRVSAHGRAQSAKYARQRREWVNKLKQEPCMDCGGKFPPECMDFDHVRGEKTESVASMRTWRMDRVLAEIEKCELICANCHRIRTRNRMIAESKYDHGG